MQEIPKDTLTLAQQGDIRAFEDIYRTSSGFVYTLALRVTNNRQDAEEVAQDVFLKVYKNIRKFRFESTFKTWIYRITTNTAINAAIRRGRRAMREIEYNDNIQHTHGYEPQQEKIEKDEKEQIIKSMLETLNPKQRSCLVLRDIEGLSYEEISRTLKININTVRSRLKRARESLLALRKKGVIKNVL
ncbi:MAG: sigma-70 family RNA polymerase sigma factor [Candidatus Omnitrophica bacterium]|nr:sigma-70 family RNA polymerase sigma factor [Candidatus Omnitrophota bacterium]